MSAARRQSGRDWSRSAADDADFRRRIDEAKERHNLSDIVAPYTTLRRRGARALSGLCPFHTEKSPSFEVNDSKGFYHCFGCGAHGDAFRFLQAKAGLTFRQAFEALTGDAFPMVTDEQRAKRKAEDATATALRISDAREVWDSAVPAGGTLAEVYCRSRAITMPLPPSIRFASTWFKRDHETGEQSVDHPAMICALQDARGEIVGVQRVFLRDDGTGKRWGRKSKLSLGIIVGAALRLDPIGRRTVQPEIIVCEGPEDGLTLAQELPGRSIWVACGTAMMSRLDLPPEIRTVTLAGDNNAAGRKAVESAGLALTERGLRVRTMFPRRDYKDWNDQLRSIRA